MYGDDDGILGHPLPADVPAREVVHGFAVARLHEGEVLVRPDGYVAKWLEGDAEAAITDFLRGPGGAV